MPEHSSILVTPVEKKIVAALRELPDGQLRGLVESFMLDLTAFVKDPKCAQVQADGIPCDDPSADCEQCLKVRDLIATLQSSIEPERI